MTKTTKKIQADANFQPQFPVVGIGASAGGLDAIRRFLNVLPADSGMAYIFVQHLSPTHSSILPEILEKSSPIKIVTITNGLLIEPNHFYVSPENAEIRVVHGRFQLDPLNSKHAKANTVDILMTSLGLTYQSYAVGIILSGALADGTLGLQVIKSYGGITFAQDGASAAFEGMPKSAFDSGVVDFVLPPEEIATHLISINAPFTPSGDLSESKQEDQDIFKQILTVLRVRRGVDFQYYKSSTLKRRIIRRMAINKLEKPADYLYRLRESKSEQDALYNDMLISVTHFFRDPATFNTLCNDIFPSLIQQKLSSGEPLRIWIAGCATGEEAYSMAICLQEHLGDKAATMKLQIFATDISEIAIAKARTGLYRQTELEGLSASRVAQFFTKADGEFQVTKVIRDMCVFANHNLLKDPPFSRMDLISCRNVLIYLEPVLQKRALSTFHYALNEAGYLLLGKSESIGTLTELYKTYHPAEKIYLRKGPVGRMINFTSSSKEETFRDIDRGKQNEDQQRDIYQIADEIMLAKFVPPGVLVNDKFDIIQFRGQSDTWLGQPQGKPSFNVLKIARNGLTFELRSLLQQAKKSNQPARKYGVFYEYNDLRHFLNIEVVPVIEKDEQHFLIVFQAASSTGIDPAMFNIDNHKTDENYNESQMRIEHLERELIQSRADMRVVSEEQESANEKLQSANEELSSSSEELQSLNEELETSREELQSTNEEIIVINNELVDRNDQLNNSRVYAEGIVSTIRDALIILDSTLKVIRATDGFYKKFRVKENETVGRYLYDLGEREWDIPELRKILEELLPRHKGFRDFQVRHEFKELGWRTLLLNARQLDENNKQILLAIEDVTNQNTVSSIDGHDPVVPVVEAFGIGIWSYDPATDLITGDQQWSALLQEESDSALPVARLLQKIAASDQQKIAAVFAGVQNPVIVRETFQLASGPNTFSLQGTVYQAEAGRKTYTGMLMLIN